MKYYLKVVALITSGIVFHSHSQQVQVNTPADTTAWKYFQATGVIVTPHHSSEVSSAGISFDISFPKGSGYGGVFRNYDLVLPDYFELSFDLRATVPVNNFEVKVSSDTTGENIWWVNKQAYSYPATWKHIVLKKRHFTFAWGPRAAASPKTLRRLEFVVTAGTGGKGTVWIDHIELQAGSQLPAVLPAPVVKASSFAGENMVPKNILPYIPGEWKSKTSGHEWIEVDFQLRREIGGVRLRWNKVCAGLSYDLLGSLNGTMYDTLCSVRNGKSGATLLFTPETEIRFLKLNLLKNSSGSQYRIEELSVVSGESLATKNQYLEYLAAEAPQGMYPRYFLRQQSYWTIVGAASDQKEALINEDGVFEVDKLRFSIEPFIRLDNNHELLTWANCREEQSLAAGYLPIPTVKRVYKKVTLDITLLAAGEAARSALMARYVLKNTSSKRIQGDYYLAMRPFQVNPTYQNLNCEGGIARTNSISINAQRALIDEKSITVSGMPSRFGAALWEEGEIVEQIAAGKLPAARNIIDKNELASAAFQYRFDLKPGDSLLVIAAVPFYPDADRWVSMPPTALEFKNAYNEVQSFWEDKLASLSFHVPADAQRYIDIMRSSLCYILINKDGPGIQPGSRTYERSWIRDGSMTSAALLKLGMRDDVKKFIEWYASYQYENGMVPCVVDQRGPDPVLENDSDGEFIFACMEYVRFTADTIFLRAHWKHIVAAVNHIQQLRSQQMSAKYRDGDDEQRAFYGLTTESISHEGYSAKPMHSYWDNFFVLKGFKDAAAAAAVLHEEAARCVYDSLVREFRKDLYNSILLSMKNRNIDYIPGCVELGDFDPTSTSISLFPCGESRFLPKQAMNRTFDKYYDWFMARACGEIPWNGFTPYEIRNVGAYIYLGQKERAHSVLEWLIKSQRPRGWNHWAEVVWNDERHAQLIGDMPHTWVASDFVNALRAMFVYEIDEDPSVIVGAGLKEEWIYHGLSVTKMPTHYGVISYSIKSDSTNTITFHLAGSINAQKTPILIPVTMLSKPLVRATINGVAIPAVQGFVNVTRLPADVHFVY